MKLRKDLERAFPVKKTVPYIIIFFLIGSLVLLFPVWKSNQPNNHFYKMELSGFITKIEREQYCTYYFIGDDWYMIQSELIDYLFEGDSVFKAENSYSVNIYNQNQLLKRRIKIEKINIEHMEGYNFE